MKASELLLNEGELSHKLRTISDLIEHVRTQEESTSNYSLLLGAGCSVTSGIRTAGQLIDGWMVDLYKRFENNNKDKPKNLTNYFEKEHASWYNPLNVYSSLFEKKYDLPPQRRRFVENEVAGKIPSIGYAYLISLVENNFFNSIFTTNFDDLINEGFYQFSNLRPIICAHDSSIHSVSITSKRPKIIKLHGDYLFDDIKSTLRETESLESNTKDKMLEFCKEYGLIVVGYSGSDRSIMDVLEYLTKKDNYLKNGIYWCLRKDDHISHAVRNLLWKEKVFPVLIDGFDELFAECHKELIHRNLEFTATLKDSKLQQCVRHILADKNNLKSNQVIANEINAISNESKRQEISSFFTDLTKDIEGEMNLSLTDLKNLLQVDKLIQNQDLKGAEQLCEDFLNYALSDETKTRYLLKLIYISDKLNDKNKSSRWCNQLVDIDQYNLGYHFKKTNSLDEQSAKFEYLKSIIHLFPNRFELLNMISHHAMSMVENNPANSKVTIDEVIEFTFTSLKLEPSHTNNAWQYKVNALYFKLQNTNDIDKIKELQANIDELSKTLSMQNEESHRILAFETKKVTDSTDLPAHEKLIYKLEQVYSRSSKQRRLSINNYLCDVYNNYGEICPVNDTKKHLKRYFEGHIEDKEIENSSKLLFNKSEYFIGIKRDLKAGKDYFNQALLAPDISDKIDRAIWLSTLVYPDMLDSVKESLENIKTECSKWYYHNCMADIHIAEGDYINALRENKRAYDNGLSFKAYLSGTSFILLKDKKYEEVLSLATKHRSELEKTITTTFDINFQYAAKKLNSNKFNNATLLNLSAKKEDTDIKIAAFSILNNENAAKRLIKQQIDRTWLNYYKYNHWVVIPKEYINKFESIDTKKTA
ncbi:MAG: hypothetical protein HKN40_08825 [Winogradskyella sp.]|uniref:SIR2 family protein n=1 Tax=Winogradskyella sp. TaxID=1883156 RepID=UPI001846214E|nr:hypothetical protein [Winogradskyella sp.]